MRRIIIAGLVLAVIGAGIGYYMYNKPADKMASMTIHETTSAAQLFQSYESDEAAANQKYLDKVVAVKGEVVKTMTEGGQTTVFLDTGDLLATIMCQMETADAASPKKGSTITIKGLCTGYLTDVVLVRSIIL